MSQEITPGADNRGQTANLSLAEKRALAERLLQKKAGAASVAFPQSYSQRSMWFFHLLDPESAAYHVAFSTRIRSAVDAPALQTAVQRVVDRHPLLRATYANGEDGPQQIIAGYRQAAFNVIDAAGWSEEELREQVLASYAEPFDLQNGPVLRVVLFWRPAPQEHESDHVLLVVAHHIVMDAWSAGIVLNELFTFYATEQTGEQVTLPPANRYADYVTWQQQLLAGPEGERLWSYWRHTLGGDLPVLALPTDFARPRVQSHAGATALAAIDKELTARLRTLARSEGVTLYMLLLSAWYTLLSAWAEQEEVLIGSPTVGRSQPAWASIVGDFVNAVVLRLRSHPQQPFRSLLGEVRRQVLEALDHQEYPFALLVERLMGGRRNPSYSPIFQAAFDLQTLRGYGALTPLFLPYDPNARVTLAGLELQPYVFPQQEGQFDLALHLIEADEHIHVALRYGTALFSAATTADALRAYTALLERIAADPTAAVGDLRLSLAGMNARTLLAHLRRQDVKVWADGDRLRVNAPAGSLSPELQKQIAARKEEIIALLAPPSAAAPAAAPVADAQQPAARRSEAAPGDGDQGAMAYWSRKLAAPLPVLNLPTDHPRPAQASTRGKRRTLAWDGETAASLQAFCEGEGVGVDVALPALLQTLLFHYTRQEEMVIGSTLPGGAGGDLVVLRTDLAGAPTFRQLLQRVGTVVREAQANQPAPFDKLVDLLQPERDPARLPFFQVLFAAHRDQPANGRAAHTASGQIEPVTVRVDLALEAFASADGVAVQIDYSADLFEDATIARLFGHLTTLLHAVLQDADTHVDRLPLLTAAERRQVLFEFNDTAVPYPQDVCIHQLIEAQVERTPDAVALVFGGQQLTYAQMNRRANQLAHYLQTAGVGPDVLVGVCMERSLEMVIALLGIHKAGGAYVPLDPAYPKERLGFVIADAAAPVVLTQAHLAANLPAAAARIVCLDSDWPTLSRYVDDNPVSAVQAHNRAYVIYTSGSTGQPKGAMNAHRGVVNRLLWMQDMYRLQADDTVLQKTPFSFDVSVWEFFWPLLCGARMVIAKPEGHKDPNYLSELIWEQQITTLHFVPSMLNAFLSAESVRPCDSVRRVICSGEALTAELQQRFFAQWQHAELHNLYGPTEAAVDVTYWECKRDSTLPIVPIGRPVANTQMYVLDPHLQPVPVGVPGELHIGGVQVGLGYLNRPELTAEKFIADPYSSGRLYKTGDLARWLPDGNIDFLGRIDFQVKIHGFRIELGEIEAALESHPAVRQAVVMARERAPGDLQLVAYLALAESATVGAKVTVAELRSYLKERLPEYMTPSAFVIVDEFPLTSSGKVNRKALPPPTEAALGASTHYVAPRSNIERQVADIWQTVLGVERVGVTDNFFDLGGHSLLIIRVHDQLRRSLAADLTIAEMFQYPTVEALAARIQRPEVPAVGLQQAQERAARQRAQLGRPVRNDR